MSDTTIRLSMEAKRRLDLHKREGESYDDVVRRLTERDKWAGFGILSDAEGDLRTAMQDVREAMSDSMAEDVAEMGRAADHDPAPEDGADH